MWVDPLPIQCLLCHKHIVNMIWGIVLLHQKWPKFMHGFFKQSTECLIKNTMFPLGMLHAASLARIMSYCIWWYDHEAQNWQTVQPAAEHTSLPSSLPGTFSTLILSHTWNNIVTLLFHRLVLTKPICSVVINNHCYLEWLFDYLCLPFMYYSTKV